MRRVENAAPLWPCLAALTAVTQSVTNALPTYQGGAAAALPTTAGSRVSRHGIFRRTQNFGQGHDLVSSLVFTANRDGAAERTNQAR